MCVLTRVDTFHHNDSGSGSCLLCITCGQQFLAALSVFLKQFKNSFPVLILVTNNTCMLCLLIRKFMNPLKVAQYPKNYNFGKKFFSEFGCSTIELKEYVTLTEQNIGL